MKVLVIGESCQDTYLYTDLIKSNPEVEGGKAYRVSKIVHKEGMALNTANNLAALGVKTYLAPTLPGISRTRLLSPEGATEVRIDTDQPVVPYSSRNVWKSIKLKINQAKKEKWDGIVIQDYGKGLVTRKLVVKCIETGIPVFVDPHKTTPLETYKGVFLIKPNMVEATTLTNLPDTRIDDMFEFIENVVGSKYVVITNGGFGSYHKARHFKHKYYQPAYSADVKDVCGAGDTYLAALVFDMLKHEAIGHATNYASKAAAVTVQHLGVYAPTLKEIK